MISMDKIFVVFPTVLQSSQGQIFLPRLVTRACAMSISIRSFTTCSWNPRAQQSWGRSSCDGMAQALVTTGPDRQVSRHLPCSRKRVPDHDKPAFLGHLKALWYLQAIADKVEFQDSGVPTELGSSPRLLHSPAGSCHLQGEAGLPPSPRGSRAPPAVQGWETAREWSGYIQPKVTRPPDPVTK